MIKIKNMPNIIQFKDLKDGDTFFYDGQVFIKKETAYIIDEINLPSRVNCIRLTNGYSYCEFIDSAPVYPVDLEITVKLKELKETFTE